MDEEGRRGTQTDRQKKEEQKGEWKRIRTVAKQHTTDSNLIGQQEMTKKNPKKKPKKYGFQPLTLVRVTNFHAF